jgi:hypothetical protein
MVKKMNMIFSSFPPKHVCGTAVFVYKYYVEDFFPEKLPSTPTHLLHIERKGEGG